jgi:hypothetical protein
VPRESKQGSGGPTRTPITQKRDNNLSSRHVPWWARRVSLSQRIIPIPPSACGMMLESVPNIDIDRTAFVETARYVGFYRTILCHRVAQRRCAINRYAHSSRGEMRQRDRLSGTVLSIGEFGGGGGGGDQKSCHLRYWMGNRTITRRARTAARAPCSWR